MVIYNITSNGPSSQLVIELINDTVYVEGDAVAYVSGHLVLDANIGNFSSRFVAHFIGKKHYKPRYKGSGKIFMKSSVGTYHKFSIKEDNKLIINNNAFVACRDTIAINPTINISLMRFFSGTPMVNMLAHGNGNLVVHMPGPVQEINMKDDKFVAYNKDIAAYSDSLKVVRQRAGAGWLNIAKKMVKVYKGTGSLYFTPHPNKDAKIEK